MNIPPIFNFAPKRKLRRRKPTGASGATALVLTSAALEFDGSLVLRLNFDREVDADAMDPSQITVEDPTGTGYRYQGENLINQPSPNELLIELAPIEPAGGSADVMTATADTGIVAIDDGGTWPGGDQPGIALPIEHECHRSHSQSRYLHPRGDDGGSGVP